MNTRLYNARILTMADGFEPIWGEIWIQDDKITYVGKESLRICIGMSSAISAEISSCRALKTHIRIPR